MRDGAVFMVDLDYKPKGALDGKLVRTQRVALLGTGSPGALIAESASCCGPLRRSPARPWEPWSSV